MQYLEHLKKYIISRYNLLKCLFKITIVSLIMILNNLKSIIKKTTTSCAGIFAILTNYMDF